MCSGSEAGSYVRLIDSCITQLKAQGPSRTWNERKEEEDMRVQEAFGFRRVSAQPHLVRELLEVEGGLRGSSRLRLAILDQRLCFRV